MNKTILYAVLLLLATACQRNTVQSFSFDTALQGVEHIDGKPQNGHYLYATAGNRLYAIGNQQGQFPAVGFHVPGEMGGVWQQPIKLLDSYSLSVHDTHNKVEVATDSSSHFVGYPFANQFVYADLLKGLDVIRTDFVPDSLPLLAIEYKIRNKSGGALHLQLTFKAHTDLSPVWLSERLHLTDGRDLIAPEQPVVNGLLVKDSLNTWMVGLASDQKLARIANYGNSTLQGKGICVGLVSDTLVVPAHTDRVVRYYIAGSDRTSDSITAHIQTAQNSIWTLFEKKKRRYTQVIDRTAAIDVPDTLLTKAYRWGKYNTDWLVRTVPSVGTGLSAGLPDYPWFFSNDQSSTFSAIVGTVDPRLFYQSWQTISRLSDRVNDSSGRIIHEASSNGVVFNKGNMQESQLFINTAWTIFKWTGNMDFLKTYYQRGKQVWKFLQQHDKNHNLYIEGYGGVEIKGLNDEMLDVAIETQSFFETMTQMAQVMNEPDLARDFKDKANRLKQKINAEWWSPSEKRYFDFKANPRKALGLIRDALRERVSDKRNHWARIKLKELEQAILSGKYKESGYNVFYNCNTSAMTEGIADSAKAVGQLEGMKHLSNKFGMYIAGIACPDDPRIDECSVAAKLKGEFNYDQAVMSAATCGMAVAACKYQGSDSAMQYIRKYLNNFSYATPGSTYEVSPDYGMFVQAWNVSGTNIPLIQYFFGVDPMAYKKEITIRPDFPSGWNYANLNNLLVGDNKLSVHYRKDGPKKTITILSDKEDWKIYLLLPYSQTVVMNGNKQVLTNHHVCLTGKQNTIAF